MSAAQPYAIRLYAGGPDLLRRGKDSPISIEVHDPTTGALATLTTATFSLVNPSGVAVVSGASATCASGVASYTVAAATVPDSLAFGDGWRGLWDVAGVGLLTRDYSLVRYLPVPSVTPDDLYARQPELARQVPSEQAAVGWQPQIAEVWRQLQEQLVEAGRRPWLIVSGGSLRLVHLFGALALINSILATKTSDGSRYATLAADYQKRADAEWARLRFEYDLDEDGRSDGQVARPVVRLTAGPRNGFGAWGGRGRC